MSSSIWHSVAAAGFALCLGAAAQPTRDPAAVRIQVTLERKSGSDWNPLDARAVLDTGDRIRFKFHSTLAGWLYAYCAGAGGESGWLIPAENGPGQPVIAGEIYVVPGNAGSYTIAGPPGFDVVYWMLSPKPLPAELLLPPAAKRPVPRTLIPRCRNEPGVLTACIDERAGPATVAQADLPPLARSNLRARELKIDKDSAVSTIAPADRNTGIIIYEFRLAHR